MVNSCDTYLDYLYVNADWEMDFDHHLLARYNGRPELTRCFIFVSFKATFDRALQAAVKLLGVSLIMEYVVVENINKKNLFTNIL